MCVLNESFPPSLTGEGLLDLVFSQARGTIARLDLGANLLHANCGRGAALIELARQFRRSLFLGLESPGHDLTVALSAARASRLQNLWIESDPGRQPHVNGSFHFALRHSHPRGLDLAVVARLLRNGGLLFDLHDHPSAVKSYRDEDLIVLRTITLPDGFCTIARRQCSPLPDCFNPNPL